MVNTRSGTNMDALSDDVKAYFDNLIQPLSKSEEIADLRKQIAGLSVTITAQNNRIEKLEATVAVQGSVIEALRNDHEALKVSVDDVQQYTRRSSVRIHGFELKDGEKNDDVLAVVEACHKEVGLQFEKAQINRAHRVGPVRTDAAGKKRQAIIVQFRSWGERCAFYQKRPKFVEAPAPGAKRRFSVSLDLTKRRLDLLSTAREAITKYPAVRFAFADLNCNIVMKVRDEFKYFNNEQKLADILSREKSADNV